MSRRIQVLNQLARGETTADERFGYSSKLTFSAKHEGHIWAQQPTEPDAPVFASDRRRLRSILRMAPQNNEPVELGVEMMWEWSVSGRATAANRPSSMPGRETIKAHNIIDGSFVTLEVLPQQHMHSKRAASGIMRARVVEYKKSSELSSKKSGKLTKGVRKTPHQPSVHHPKLTTLLVSLQPGGDLYFDAPNAEY